MPTCTLQITYVSDPGEFFFACINSPPSWLIHPDGTVIPPSRIRVIELVTDSTTAEFFGFVMSYHRDDVTNPENHKKGFVNLTGLKVSHVDTGGDGVVDLITIEDPISTSGGDPLRAYYAIGLRVGETGKVVWDDPKIYHPPDL